LVLAGPDQRDPLSASWPPWREPEAATERLRILYVPTFGASPVDPEIHSSVADAADALRQLGHEVEAGDVPFDFERVAQAFGTVATAGLVWLLRDHQWAGRITSGMQAMADAGVKLTAADYAEALAIAHRVKLLLAELFDRFDMLLTPAAAALHWPAEQSHPPTIAGQQVGPRGHAVFTGFANVAGCPAIALPCAPSHAGLPIGLQLVARPGADETLIALAKTYEAARPWRELRPLLEAVCSTAL
jgi:aspartyl-tRNA(Asn)/glutamyl-tRNA(Gln) amidotransferase subunit A